MYIFDVMQQLAETVKTKEILFNQRKITTN